MTDATQQSFPLGKLAFCVAATLFIFTIQILWMWDSVWQQNKSIEHLARINQLHGEVMLYDESLSMSTKMAVLTDDTKWVKNSPKIEQLLNNALAELIKLSNQYGIEKDTSQTKANFKQLRTIERDALGLLESGAQNEAKDLLLNADFEALQLASAQGMEHTLLLADNHFKDLYNSGLNNIKLNSIVHLLLLLVIGLLWYFYVLSHRRWRNMQWLALENAHNERSFLESELTQSEQRLAHILECSPVGTAVVNNRNQFTYINSRYANICNISKDDIIGTDWKAHPNLNNSNTDIEGFLEAAKRGEHSTTELSIKRDGYGSHWVRLSASPVDLEDQSMIIVTLEDIQHLRETKKQLNQERYSDALTMLPNRTAMIGHINAWLHVNKRGLAEHAALLHLDIDHFKRINDGLGEQAADSILHTVARRLYRNNSVNSFLARNSGDEFLIFLRNTDIDRAIEVAEHLLEQLREPYSVDGRPISITASIGILPLPCEAQDSLELLRHAESAAYLAKASGRNTYRIFHADLHEESARRLLMESHLRAAIEHETLEVHYQPILDLSSSKVVGSEALIRWHDDELGTVTPNEFIPLAEELQLTSELAMLVFESACNDLPTLNLLSDDNFSIAINCSAQQLEDEAFIVMLLVNKEIRGIPNHHFEFEITERVLMTDSPVLSKNLDRLVAAGFRLSIDDFGTGYSALSYLKKYPFHTVKIDRSFVVDMEDDAASTALCQAVVGMANALEMQTVAEGIENKAQETLLKNMGATLAQGFYYSPALPAETFNEWYARYLQSADSTIEEVSAH